MSLRSIRRQRERGRAKAAAAGVAVSILASALPCAAPDVAAYPLQYQSCQRDNVTLDYQGNNWGGLTGLFTQGAFLWNGVQRATGGRFTNIDTGAFGAVSTRVTREELGGSTVGRSNCSLVWLKVDDDVAGSAISAVAVHEMGHTIGFLHSGSGDAISSSTSPAMSTCRSFTSAALTQDDFAHMASLYTNTLHADSSFENQQLNFWGRTGVTMHLAAGVASEGSVSARVPAVSGATESGVFQTVRHTAPIRVRMRANYKDGSPNASGSVALRIQPRRVSYPTHSGDCGYLNDWDLNAPNVAAFSWVTPSTTATVHDGWHYADTSAWKPSSSWQGADVRAWLYKQTTDQIWIDNMRAYRS